LPRRREVASEERLRELEEKYEGYTVYDNQGSKIGKVDDLFVDEKDHEEYIGVKLGLLGRKSTLIPTEIVRVNESDRTIEVSESKDHVKEAPSFDDDEDVTAEYEERIRGHFGLESLQGSASGSYGASTGTAGSASGSRAGTASGAASGSTAGAAVGSGTSEQDEGHSSESSGYAPEGAGSGGSSGETYSGNREGSSGTDSEYEENEGATAPGLGASEGTSGTGYYEQSGGSGVTGERSEASGSSPSGMTGGSGRGFSGSQPGTTRQTEETETFQEGGRTKIRRRVIREEVVDADDQGSST
jgi:sporulation protein YlmC with PRC-barrel domain